jgi:hypothetical protein
MRLRRRPMPPRGAPGHPLVGIRRPAILTGLLKPRDERVAVRSQGVLQPPVPDRRAHMPMVAAAVVRVGERVSNLGRGSCLCSFVVIALLSRRSLKRSIQETPARGDLGATARSWPACRPNHRHDAGRAAVGRVGHAPITAARSASEGVKPTRLVCAPNTESAASPRFPGISCCGRLRPSSLVAYLPTVVRIHPRPFFLSGG